jgi:hypothetical protein
MKPRIPDGLDESDYSGADAIGFYDCFERDDRRVTHPRDMIAALEGNPEPIANAIGCEPDDRTWRAMLDAIAEPIAFYRTFNDADTRERLKTAAAALAKLRPDELMELGIDPGVAERLPRVRAGRPVVRSRADLVATLAAAFRQFAAPSVIEPITSEPVRTDDLDESSDGDEYHARVAARERADTAALDRAREQARRSDRKRLAAFVLAVFDTCELPDRPGAHILDDELRDTK